MMTLWQFVLLADQELTRDQLDGLFTRWGDLAVEQGGRRGAAEVRFDRDAPTLLDAIVSGVRDLEAIGVGAVGVRDDDDLVTLPVIAERIGRSCEAVRLWAAGRTGPGAFPAAVDAGLGIRFYRWSQVAPWLSAYLGTPVEDPEPVLTAVNLALQLRGLAPRVARMEVVRSLFTA